MATNIEMNVKQESDYEVIYPQTICDMVINLLNPDTKVLMGLEPTADADDAFRKVYLAQVLDGRALINFTVMGDDGTPCAGVQIESAQFCDSTGNKEPVIETDDEGKVSIFVDNISVQANISNYANLSNWNETIPVEFGQQYDKSITLTRYNFKLWESSGQCKFSPEIVRVDVSLCGGGGGGQDGITGRGSLEWRNNMSGNGGGGGFADAQENVDFQAQQIYTYTVGSGGSSGDPGTAGGKSSFLSLSVNGGGSNRSYSGNRPNGNGRGGLGQNGGQSNGQAGEAGEGYVYISFNTQENCGGGGASGTIISLSEGEPEDISYTGLKGGSPNGGKGGNASTVSGIYTATNGEDGKKYGGGGGGGSIAVMNRVEGQKSDGGKGGSGVVSIRIYRQQDLT